MGSFLRSSGAARARPRSARSSASRNPQRGEPARERRPRDPELPPGVRHDTSVPIERGANDLLLELLEAHALALKLLPRRDFARRKRPRRRRGGRSIDVAAGEVLRREHAGRDVLGDGALPSTLDSALELAHISWHVE